MHIEPDDLGNKWHILLVRERTQDWWSRFWHKNRPPEPRLGALGRLWNKDLKLDPETAAATFPLSAEGTLGWVYGLGAAVGAGALGSAAALLSNDQGIGAAVALGVGGAGGWLGAVTLPRVMLRRLHRRPVTADEIEEALGMEPNGPFFQRLAAQLRDRFGVPGPEASDPLEKAFLLLALEVIQRDIPAEAQEDIRAALRALGEAITRLPPPLDVSDEMTVLRQKADAADYRAREEADSVVAASLERQAAALRRQADAAEEANRLARRVRVLRQEMATQIASLRAGLDALGACRTDEAASLVHCAEAVRSVASEAASVAAARQELNDLRRPPAARTEEAPELRLRRG